MSVLAVLFAARLCDHERPAVSPTSHPRGGCTNSLVAEVGAAQRMVLDEADSFPCPDIVTAPYRRTSTPTAGTAPRVGAGQLTNHWTAALSSRLASGRPA